MWCESAGRDSVDIVLRCPDSQHKGDGKGKGVSSASISW